MPQHEQNRAFHEALRIHGIQYDGKPLHEGTRPVCIDSVLQRVRHLPQMITSVPKPGWHSALRYEQGRVMRFMVQLGLPCAWERYVTACMLGHALLHVPERETGELFWTYGSLDPRDREAAAFASELLAPVSLVKAGLAAGLDNAKLADMLAVPLDAIQYQVRVLRTLA